MKYIFEGSAVLRGSKTQKRRFEFVALPIWDNVPINVIVTEFCFQ